MRHYLQMKAALPLEKTALFKQTYIIIDSKMQYIDFQIRQYYEQCTCPVKHDSDQTDIRDKQELLHNLDKILTYVDSLRHDLELLQTLKVWLREDTADKVYALLKDNDYVNYSSDNLEALIKSKIAKT